MSEFDEGGRMGGMENGAGGAAGIPPGATGLGAGPTAGKIRKKRRGVAILPSLFTLGNCLCGFASLSFAALGIVRTDAGMVIEVPAWRPSNYAIAGYFIFAAMVFDMFDGFVARLTRSASDFGAELDSLADMVSFGIAPAFLMIHLIGDLFKLSGNGQEFYALPFSDDLWLRLFWVIAAIYVSCTALRLARFNVINKHDVGSHMSFRGMPSPGAAAVVAATVIFYESLRTNQHHLPFHVTEGVQKQLGTVFPYLLPVVMLVAALLMVSRFAYTHLINRFLRGRKTFRTLVGFFLLIMVIVVEPQIAVILGIYLYALSAPVAWLFRMVAGTSKAGAAAKPR